MRPSIRYHILLLLTVFIALLTSCVDAFDADLPAEDTNIPVIEGAIISDTVCCFTVTHTADIASGVWSNANAAISSAQLSVEGSDGSSWTAEYAGAGKHYVRVGKLKDDVEYHVVVRIKDEIYSSQPERPVPASDLAGIRFEPSEWAPDINILLSAEPSAEGCYVWTAEECWEINTPYLVSYLYFPEIDSIGALPVYLSRGWCHHTLVPFIGTSDDYTDGHIADHLLHSIYRNDNRFNTLYSVLITQRAVSRKEYEYERLLRLQSNEMGGLFTPLPTQLPGNVFCSSNPSLRAMGFVGVSAGTSSYRLYISSEEAGYVLQRMPNVVSEEEIGNHTPYELYKMGYRIHTHSIQGTQWTWPWCIDCTDSYWGATRERPDFWPPDPEPVRP